MDESQGTTLERTIEGILQASLIGFVGSMPVSIAMCQISLGVGWLAWLSLCLMRRRWLGYATGLDLPLGLFLAACLLATIFSPQPLASLMGLKKFYLASGLYLTAYACRILECLRKTTVLFILFAALTAVYGLIMHYGGLQARVTGTQTMALTAGGIFMMAGLMAAVLAVEGKVLPRWLSVPGTASLAGAMVLTQSAGSLFSYIAALLSVLALSKKWKILVVSLLVMASVVAIFMALPAGKGSTVEVQKANTWQLRRTIWSVGLRVVAERPLTGHGLVDLGEAYRRNRQSWDLERDPWGAWNYGHLHNNFLQVAAISGFIGLAAFVFLLYTSLRLGLTVSQDLSGEALALGRASFAAALGFMVNGLTEWNFGDSEVVTIFWFILGTIAALKSLTVQEPMVLGK